MLAELLSLPFISSCNGLETHDKEATVTREIDGGKESISCTLPLVIGGQKGLVEESELRIPNMRGIMQARTKPLIVIEAEESKNLTESVKFDKPNKKENCKIISSENVVELVNLLQNEAKVL